MTITTSALAICFVYIILPIILIVKIWRNRSIDFLNWILWASSSGVYVCYLYYIGMWPSTVFGYYFRYILLTLFIITAFKSFFNCKRIFLPVSKNRIVTLSVIGMVCVFQFWIIFSTYVSSFRCPEGIQLDFPLKNGEYYVAQGGNNSITNHHYEVSAQKYAIDILKLNTFGLKCNTLNACVLENYNIFGDTLYSPCNGKIVDLVDGNQDQKPGIMDEEHPAGNYLVIELEETNASVILAHIMQGSFLVKKGDIVKRGQPLAKVGNSGNTSEPHLHMHAVMNQTGNLLFTGQGVPMKFGERFLVRNDRIY